MDYGISGAGLVTDARALIGAPVAARTRGVPQCGASSRRPPAGLGLGDGDDRRRFARMVDQARQAQVDGRTGVAAIGVDPTSGGALSNVSRLPAPRSGSERCLSREAVMVVAIERSDGLPVGRLVH